MYGRNYIEKDIGLDIYRKKCLDLHQKKLQTIKTKHKKIEIKKVEEIMTRKHEEKHRNFEFMKQEREIEVNRNNKKLLEKLVEISKGKHLSVEAFQPVNHTISTSNLGETVGGAASFRPKSLNIVTRKQQSQKIEEDNFKFAKRLFESHGLISVKEMRDQFKEHVKIKKQVRKLILKKDGDVKGSKGRYGMLPPLTQSSHNTVKGTTKNVQQINDDLTKETNEMSKNILIQHPKLQQSQSPFVLDQKSSSKNSSAKKKKITLKANVNTSNQLKQSQIDAYKESQQQQISQNDNALQPIQSQSPLKDNETIPQQPGSQQQMVNIANDFDPTSPILQLSAIPDINNNSDSNKNEVVQV